MIAAPVQAVRDKQLRPGPIKPTGMKKQVQSPGDTLLATACQGGNLIRGQKPVLVNVVNNFQVTASDLEGGRRRNPFITRSPKDVRL